MNHRNGEIGSYLFKETGDKSAILICSNPYPDTFDLGIIQSTTKKFSKPGDRVAIKVDETKETRTKGGNTTTYIVKW